MKTLVLLQLGRTHYGATDCRRGSRTAAAILDFNGEGNPSLRRWNGFCPYEKGLKLIITRKGCEWWWFLQGIDCRDGVKKEAKRE